MSLALRISDFATRIAQEIKSLQGTIVASSNLMPDKKLVKTVATVDITLSGLQTINGVVLISSDRVLVAGQTLSQYNGVYAAKTGAWTRSSDADDSSKLAGIRVFVNEGTYAGFHYRNRFKNTGILGTTPMPWHITPGSDGGLAAEIPLTTHVTTFGAGWTGTVQYQRSGNVVTLLINLAKASWVMNDAPLVTLLPVEIRPTSSVYPVGNGMNTAVDNAARNFYVESSGHIRMGAAGTASVYGIVTYQVSDTLSLGGPASFGWTPEVSVVNGTSVNASATTVTTRGLMASVNVNATATAARVSGNVLFTIPIGARPATSRFGELTVATGTDVQIRVHIEPNGDVTSQGAIANGGILRGNLTYPIAATPAQLNYATTSVTQVQPSSTMVITSAEVAVPGLSITRASTSTADVFVVDVTLHIESSSAAAGVQGFLYVDGVKHGTRGITFYTAATTVQAATLSQRYVVSGLTLGDHVFTVRAVRYSGTGGTVYPSNSALTVTSPALFEATTLDVWTAYAPVWGGGSTLGNGTVEGAYDARGGKTVHIRAQITFGSTTALSTNAQTLSLPFPVKVGTSPIFRGEAYDLSVGGSIPVSGVMGTGGTDAPFLLCPPVDPGAYERTVKSGIPFSFNAGDRVTIHGTYERA